ncbi:MAG: UDP-N-acetylmuramoyl-tripeptide--D-alanyl-D-alanine ligase [Pseudomonadota bacterium]
MTPLWTSADAAAATGGTTGDWQATGVSIDTRTIQPGDLFVALTDQRDGHDFVDVAIKKGAAAALVSRYMPGVPDDKQLKVPDVLGGLRDLAKAARKRTRARVVAVTGSVGKTSTKEMLRAALAPQGRTHAAEASYNNHWGVPLTLARMPQDTDFAVIEIGMSAPGEIAPLARLAKPHVAMVTTIAAAHLEAFDDLSGIAREKGAIFEGLQKGGTALWNADVGTADLLDAAAHASKAAEFIAFGEAKAASARLIQIHPSERITVAEAEIDGQSVLFKLATPGAHFALNGVAVLAAAQAMGADLARTIQGLGGWAPPAGRGTAERLALDPVEDWWAKLIDDAFNANPASMAAAFDVLALTEPHDNVGRVAKGRRIAILGDMLELGPEAAALHAALADHPAMAKIDRVDCVGPRMKSLWAALPTDKRGAWEETADALAAKAHMLVDAGDVVLVKGSKGSQVSRVVTAMRNLGQGRVKGQG